MWSTTYLVEPFSFSNCCNQENFPPRENVTTIWRTISQTSRAPNSFPINADSFFFWAPLQRPQDPQAPYQGHPTTVICEISVRRSKYCLEFSISWGQLKISRWPFHSHTIFEACVINSVRFSEVWFFILHCQIRLFSQKTEET